VSYKMVRMFEGRTMRIQPRGEDEGISRRRVDARGRKTMRAYSAYLELRDTAAWMNEELTAQLRNHDMTMLGFRVLNLLRRGPQYLEEMSRQLNCEKAHVAKVLKRLRASGWVKGWRRRIYRANASDEATEHGGAKPRGRLVKLVGFTNYGRERFKWIHAKHVKLAKALLRALEGREQLTLTRLCMKLRRGNVLQFALEARWWERDEDWAQVVAQR
jgi:DNA-binding MarR family transcriptional regulator